jgi:hypothetical protein
LSAHENRNNLVDQQINSLSQQVSSVLEVVNRTIVNPSIPPASPAPIQPIPITSEPGPSQQVVVTAQGNNSEPKAKLPERYSGDREKFRGFVVQLELAFSLQPLTYHSDRTKIATFGTLLEGKALAWFIPFNDNGTVDNLSWADFKMKATMMFGDSSRKLMAESKLMNLLQKNNLNDYIASFVALAAEVDWNEASLVMHFRRGLNAKILDLMLSHEHPSTLADAIELAIKVNNRIWEADQLQRSRHPPNQFKPGPSSQRPKTKESIPPPPVQRARDPDAMDLDSSRRGPLSPTERQRRFSMNLCLYCGEAGHNRGNCPARQKSLNSSSTSTPIQSGKVKNNGDKGQKEENQGKGNGR